MNGQAVDTRHRLRTWVDQPDVPRAVRYLRFQPHLLSVYGATVTGFTDKTKRMRAGVTTQTPQTHGSNIAHESSGIEAEEQG